MSWEFDIKRGEALLAASRIPPSLEIINLIKKVNPTKLSLSDVARERGYEIKGKLQNLLLENYGEAFYLSPHPYSDNTVLIKHTSLSNIDACHAELRSLSCKALATVASPVTTGSSPQAPKPLRTRNSGAEAADFSLPRDALKQAQKLLDEYDYVEAEELLAGIRVAAGELDILERAALMLVEELGAYGRAIETLLAQPKQVIRDRGIRELLALAYYLNGAHPEAKAIFDSLHPAELRKEALYAYADISFRDGNLLLAYHIARIAEETAGFVPGFSKLIEEIEAGMQLQAEPLLQRAQVALECGAGEQAAALAREALEHCPNSHKAREIMAVTESEKRAVQVAAMWSRVRQAQGEAKVELLEQLLERDPNSREQIRELLAAEKALLEKEQVRSRLARLRRLAEKGVWQECFPILQWLAAQPDHAEEYREACQLSPNFSVLYRNRRLERVPDKVARELWLDFVRASSPQSPDQQEERFRILEKIKPYFNCYPGFLELYDAALAAQQERVREEVRAVLDQLAHEETTVAQVTRAIAVFRKNMLLLPPEEGVEYLRLLECRLAQLAPEQEKQEEEALLAAYCEAVQSGDTKWAAAIREEISDTDRLGEIDREIAEMCSMETAAIPLAFADDLPVDVGAEPALEWRGATDRHLLLCDPEGALVVVNVADQTATRFSSPYFRNLMLCDAIPARDTFLFRAKYDKNIFLRAELSGDRGAFTALLDMSKDFALEEGVEVCNLFMSSEKCCEYYLSLTHQDGSKPGRIVRKRVNNRNKVSHAVQDLDQAVLYCRRLSSEPDKFIIGAEGETRVCTRNLTTDVVVRMTPDIWQVDEAEGRIYYFCSTMLERADLDFYNYEQYTRSGICHFFSEQHDIMALSPGTDTVLLQFRSRAALYNYRTNRISRPFAAGRIIGTAPARKWYCYQYCQEPAKLILRDITAQLHDVLQWEDAWQFPQQDWHSDEATVEIMRQVYFGYAAEE